MFSVFFSTTCSPHRFESTGTLHRTGGIINRVYRSEHISYLHVHKNKYILYNKLVLFTFAVFPTSIVDANQARQSHICKLGIQGWPLLTFRCTIVTIGFIAFLALKPTSDKREKSNFLAQFLRKVLSNSQRFSEFQLFFINGHNCSQTLTKSWSRMTHPLNTINYSL